MISANNKLRNFFTRLASVYTRPLVRRIVLALAFFVLYTITLSTDFIPDKVSLQVGQVSDRDVIAPRTVSYIDTAKTKQLEAEVLASIANVYDLDVAVMTKVEVEIKTIFRAAQQVITDKNLDSTERKLDKLDKDLTELKISLPSNVLSDLITLDEATLPPAEEYVKSALRKHLQRGIHEDELDIARKQIVVETEELGLGNNTEAVVAGIAQKLLRPNFILNARETEKRKQAALATIEPVRQTVKKGQVLVRRGDVITPERINVMNELGLYAGNVNEMRILGLAIFVLLAMIIALGYLYKFAGFVYGNDMYLVLLGLIILVTLLLGKAAHYYSDFAAPIAAGALLTAILIDTRVALLMGVIVAMLFGVIVDHDFRAVAVALTGSLAGVYSVTKKAHGYSLTRAGIWIAAINFLVISSTGFIEEIDNREVLFQAILGIFNGIAAAIITTGILPYLEHAFNLTSSVKLLDLARPNHPLLQRLLLDAPGTYHHSILVGNLAETAAVAIGADPVTVRVGAYYHDIGKIKRPYFFGENQVDNENPHDKIAPSLSTLIVTSHIKDGLDLCRDYKLPQVITDIIQQHHGTTLVSYFYKRATENEHGECIIEADFRYEGPRPQSKEVALVMLADACEAAVRSISKPNVNRIEGMVRKIIRERLHDGQLDDCNLTLKDLNVIGDVYIRLLSSMFHTRIEYPDALKELERKKLKNGNANRQCAEKDDNNGTNDPNSAGSSK
ncbi:MAG TPA: HDIG domain-containing protein [Methylomusa anaerophila]|uniref:Ribonuclease Y n=1 Tax=Methylomusa anaerophila TaxID=1930071 RepID=A0A348ANZ3_9FIRM|nr:HDIG domain-containing metalloprotein [Methylomusa anaerophila]BBB92791.1 ribonuclease Y [Methylomusa anaerophila]HML87358.1 HDIG domain-containing protein [Methylomusa anaerophila]